MNRNIITSEDINALLAIQPAGTWVTSFYLNVDPRRINPSKYKTVAKNMLREKLQSLEKEGLSKEQITMVQSDFKKIEQLVANIFELSGRMRGLVIIADGARDIFQVFRVAQPVKSQVVVDPDPYIRPLIAILDEYHRLMLALVDEREARLVEVYMGEVLEHEALQADIRGKVTKAGWYGLEERRIERSITNKIIRHYKNVADAIMQHFRKGHFEYLFVGMKAEEYGQFFPLLHSYIQPRVKGRLDLGAKDPISLMVEEVLKAEQQIEREEDDKVLAQLIDTAAKGGWAVTGLEKVLHAIPLGACQVLVVDDYYYQPGYTCEDCSYLDVSPGQCPICGKETLAVEDVVEEAMEEVLLHRGEIKYITTGHPRLAEISHIGALLRFAI